MVALNHGRVLVLHFRDANQILGSFMNPFNNPFLETKC